MFGKFKPIKIEGKDLREEIDNIRDKKRGFKLLLLDLAEVRCSVDKQVNVWFDKVFKKYNIKIIPHSWLGGDFDEMFNGVHFHFRNGNNNNFEKTLFNIYPFVLALTDCFMFSPFSSKALFISSKSVLSSELIVNLL